MKRLYVMLAICSAGLLVGMGLCGFDNDTHSLGGDMSGRGASLILVFGIAFLSTLGELIRARRRDR